MCPPRQTNGKRFYLWIQGPAFRRRGLQRFNDSYGNGGVMKAAPWRRHE